MRLLRRGVIYYGSRLPKAVVLGLRMLRSGARVVTIHMVPDG